MGLKPDSRTMSNIDVSQPWINPIVFGSGASDLTKVKVDVISREIREYYIEGDDP